RKSMTGPGAVFRDSKIRDGWKGSILSALMGGLLPLAFAPVNLYPLAIISPAILFWLWLESTPRRAFALGYLYGLGFFGVGVSWVAVSFYRFGNMGITLSTIATLLFVFFLALFPAALGWLSRRYFGRLNQTACLIMFLPAGWVLFEWIRGWIFTGFPWLHLGNSQTDSPLAGLAPVIGVYGISWATAFSAGVLTWVWLGSSRQRIAGLSAVIVLWLVSGLLTFVEWSTDKGEPLTASLIQGNVPQNLKWRPDQRRPTIDMYTRYSRERWDKDIIIWPETAMPAFYHQAEGYLKGLAREASLNGGATLLMGLPVVDTEDPDHYYNSVVRVGGDVRNGEEQATQFYFKSHLVPFGEYIPLKFLLGNLLDILKVPMADFSRGDEDQPLLTVAGHSLGVSICYEDVFGEEVIRGLPEASLLVNVSNDAWFGDSLAPHQHLQMARMRTMETARPMLRATNNGVSAIIDHRGKIQSVSPQFVETVLDGEVQPRQGVTPYVIAGNWPVLAGLVVVLAFCGWLTRTQSPQKH
ncbi:apolipoprotein N-acyltransferase, partial [Kaarinaea lacus]